MIVTINFQEKEHTSGNQMVLCTMEIGNVESAMAMERTVYRKKTERTTKFTLGAGKMTNVMYGYRDILATGLHAS